ncbi:MAG: nicotinamide-nucleotide amidohydrolase family protein [Candidatus Nanopelagicales bacterium]
MTDAVPALRDAGRTVAAAESLTGGGVCVALSEAAGSSEVFVGGVVTYAISAKTDLLGVPAALLAEVGPVHPAVAGEMARRVAALTGADIGVATPRVAGPEPHGGREPGFALVGWWCAGRSGVVEVVASGDRAAVRATVVAVALEVVTVCARHGAVRARDLTVAAEVTDRE